MKKPFSATPIGVGVIFKDSDPRLYNKVDIHVQYAGKGLFKGKVCHKTVSVTEAEKAVIESIAMRLFLEHKKIVRRVPCKKDGCIELQGLIAVDVDL